ncbi:hypothetical protein L1987_05097 [Smallanthus sonchifolius]|uniref:Uncharacterized protein n=1 Tax=Smallanthus sonchifolius TaxID=185202 RepID=A0ACB9JUI7_9ASTR|nr:hypothetical protein L1987_05097 [Smallanthus sonchifolius]
MVIEGLNQGHWWGISISMYNQVHTRRDGVLHGGSELSKRRAGVFPAVAGGFTAVYGGGKDTTCGLDAM